MIKDAKTYDNIGYRLMKEWRNDWCKLAKDALGASLDSEQEEILRSFQYNKMTSVASGTARGKDFCASVAALCFLYLTPKWNDRGEMVENTKVILSAPTSRQVQNIMTPEFTRLFTRAKNRGVELPGRLVGDDIRTEFKEWFLTGFKSDDTNMEAWSGLHASHIAFIITEATGVSETIFNAIEGNLQGHSRILIVFNPNISSGYAAASQKSKRWNKFRLDSLNAPNVIEKKQIIPGQVDYDWVKDKVETWCTAINKNDFLVEEGDFEFEGNCYRPNDLFRVKVRGMAPKVSSGVLVPPEWIEKANERWKQWKQQGWGIVKPLRLGVDVAGMGRDSTAKCFRYANLVDRFEMIHSGGTANHMQIAGMVVNIHKNDSRAQSFIDTIGEGAGVYSAVDEKGYGDVCHSVKFSESAEYDGQKLTDTTGQYQFLNMRAYLYWAVRDWLNPINNNEAALPPDDELFQELTETQWMFKSNGSIQIEPKEDIQKRIKRSPDKADSLANTFYPVADRAANQKQKKQHILSVFK